jgi:hypothetical protein
VPLGQVLDDPGVVERLAEDATACTRFRVFLPWDSSIIRESR